MAYVDQFYTDASGGVHWLSADDQANAVAQGLPLPAATWTAITADAAQAILNPPPTLAQAQAAQIAALTAACAAAITGGYSSSALGAPHTYPSGTTDQINMMGSVTASTLPAASVAGWTTPFWCEDATGAWSYQNHTAAQIQQAGSDGKAWVVACQLKLAGLNAQVAAATTAAAVEAVTWTA